jgi:hypothetical protein
VSARPSPSSKTQRSGPTPKPSSSTPRGHGVTADPTRLDSGRGQARAAIARATAPSRDPGGVWRARLSELPGGAGGALIGAWEDFAWARECGGATRADAERLAFDDVAALRGRP